MAEKKLPDIYLYSEGAAKKKAHQSRERAKAREKQQLQQLKQKAGGDPRQKSMGRA